MKIFRNRLIPGKAIGAQPTLSADINAVFEILENMEGCGEIEIDRGDPKHWRIKSTPRSEADSGGAATTPETDNRSIEVSSEEKLQLVRFDDGDVTDKGLSELIVISDDKLSAVSDAGNYEIVVRVKGASGDVIGYMPFGAGDGEGNEDAPADEAATCDQNDHPGDEDYSDDHGVMGGGFYRAYGYGEGDFEGDDADSDDTPDPDRHPAEGDCYSTAT